MTTTAIFIYGFLCLATFLCRCRHCDIIKVVEIELCVLFAPRRRLRTYFRVIHHLLRLIETSIDSDQGWKIGHLCLPWKWQVTWVAFLRLLYERQQAFLLCFASYNIWAEVLLWLLRGTYWRSEVIQRALLTRNGTFLWLEKHLFWWNFQFSWALTVLLLLRLRHVMLLRGWWQLMLCLLLLGHNNVFLSGRVVEQLRKHRDGPLTGGLLHGFKVIVKSLILLPIS